MAPFPPLLTQSADLVLLALDLESGEPVPGVEFYIRDPGVSGSREGSLRTTGPDGTARWEGIPPGRNQLNLRRGEWMRLFAGGGRPVPYNFSAGLNDLTLDLDPGDNEIEVKLERGVHLSGTVLSPRGEPVGDAWVQLRSETGSSLTGDARFDMRTSLGDGSETRSSAYGDPGVYPAGRFQGWVPASRDPWDFALTARERHEAFRRAGALPEEAEQWDKVVSKAFAGRSGERKEFVLRLKRKPQSR